MDTLGIANNIWATVLGLGSIQGFLLGFGLLSKKNRRTKSNFWLAVITFITSYTILENAILISSYRESFIHILSTSSPLSYLFGPFLYFYTLAYTNRQFKLSKLDFLHFIPALAATAYVFEFWFYVSAEFKIWALDAIFTNKRNMNLATFMFSSINILQSIIYFYLSLRKYKQVARLQSFSPPKDRANKRLGWLKKTILFFILIFIIEIIISLSLSIPNSLRLEIRYFYFLGLTFIIYGLGFLLMKNTSYFPFKDALYEKPLKTKNPSRLQTELIRFMEKEQPFLNANLKTDNLAKKLEISPHQLSQLLNAEFQTSFPDFVNTFRIKEATRLLKLPANRNATILAIALDSGFKSQANFIRVFKKHIGQTPHQFRKDYLLKIS